MTRATRVKALSAAVGLAAISVTVVMLMSSSSKSGPPSDPGRMSGMGSEPGSSAEFAFLRQQSSNQCGLTPDGVMQMPTSGRLQGSCCSGMEMASYRRQVAGLSQLAGSDVILRDPYDVPVALAQRLLGFERSIQLDDAQQATYDAAMQMTPDKGPCCCHCWRWDMTVGLARYLIVRNHWDAAQVANVVALTNGCGGSWEPATT